MRNKIVDNWYNIAVLIAGAIAATIALGNWDQRIELLLFSLLFIQLHFFEEFMFPGGFPWAGMKAERGNTDPDTSHWELNDLSSFWGNEWFAIAVYVLPIFLPQVPFLTLAAFAFAFAELLMHLVFFNIRLRTWYNPGLFTTVVGLVPVSLMWLVPNVGAFGVLDWVLAIAWIAFNYWMAFVGPVFKKFGANKRYSFQRDMIMRSERHMNEEEKAQVIAYFDRIEKESAQQ